MTSLTQDGTTAFDHDVAVVGGGPAGCAAAVFAGRYGLDTLVLDRGRSSLQRIGHLENYLGFPGGIDVATFRELAHAHVERSGCSVVEELVESVDRLGTGFELRTDEGRTVTAERVVAASKYDHDYLTGLDDALFTTETYDGEEYEVVDAAAVGDEGRTPVDRLYVTGRLATDDAQVQLHAGHGAAVGLGVVTDRRRDRGFPEELATAYNDCVVVEGGYGGDDWESQLREQFDEALSDAHSLDEEAVDRLRAAWVREHRDWEISAAEQRRRRRDGQRALAAAIDDDLLLDEVDDARLLERAAELGADVPSP